MNLRDYKTREQILLRLAPWADLRAIREALTKKVLQELENRPSRYGPDATSQIHAFINGDAHVLPTTTRFRDFLSGVLSSQHQYESQNDRRYYEAYEELVLYFFSNDRYLGLS